MTDHEEGPRHSLTGGAGPYLMLGWQIAFAFLVYAAIGFFLDRYLDTSPWLLIAGVLMGLVAVFARIYRVALETNRRYSKRVGSAEKEAQQQNR